MPAVDINGEQHITLTTKIKAEIGKSATTLEDAHRIATYVQNLIIKQTGAASRVIVHTEPAKQLKNRKERKRIIPPPQKEKEETKDKEF
jgi:divalent metal cation (Fe/Co/Zn/Cd) transporter